MSINSNNFKNFSRLENILIIGNGGRENSLAWAIQKNELVKKVYLIPGNAGSERINKCERIKIDGAFESEMKKIWYDSHVHSKEALELLIKVVGDDKIVYGTNFAGWDQPDKYDINKTTSNKWYKNTLELFMIQK